ncbi:MAG TPA: spore coat U domain-containing protein [Gammaproteobacteria bacterium]|nr:spore coat U domain-containing protein [Gammaproteobacteria bacterium]
MRVSKSTLGFTASALLMALVSGAAFGGSASGTLSVSATVNTNCTVNSPTLTFTAIDPTAGVNSTGSATLSVKCTKGTTLLDIKLGPGGHQIASGKRQLNNGAVNIPYQLFTDAGFTTLWGDSTTTGIGSKLSTGFSAFSSVNTAQTFTVFGQILVADEDVAANTYTDSVAITVDF